MYEIIFNSERGDGCMIVRFAKNMRKSVEKNIDFPSVIHRNTP